MRRYGKKTVENLNMEFNDKNIEMVKMMAKIERLDSENKNMAKLLNSQSQKIECRRTESRRNSNSKESLTTPKGKNSVQAVSNRIDTSQDYQLFKEEDGEWKEYESEGTGSQVYRGETNKPR